MNPILSPLTGLPNVELLESLEAERLRALWKKLGVGVERELRGIDEIRLYRCRDTNLRFFHPPQLAGQADFYSRLQASLDWYYDPTLRGKPSGAGRWEHDYAKRSLSGAKRVFEIGCGDGSFLERVDSKEVEAIGIDLNPDAVTAARQKGLTVERLSLAKAVERWSRSFDAVCAFQTLEHVPDPLAFTRSARALVRPGGQLVFAVPNAESYLRHLTDNVLDMPPHHITRWSRDTFHALARILGMSVDAIRAEPLAERNYQAFLKTVRSRLSRILGAGAARCLINDRTKPVYGALLSLGARRLVRGHTLYAALREPTAA